MGYTLAQGFHFAAAAPPAEVDEIIRRRPRATTG